MATIQKRYDYKVYRAGTYLGLLQNVTSKFEYSQDINTAGSQLQIQVAQTVDIIDQAPSHILTEAGDFITDESGNRLLTERAADVVGNSSDDILIRNGNIVKVYEYSDYWPNGQLRFSGVMESWAAQIGNQDGDDVIDIIVNSQGLDLSNYINISGFSAQISKTTFTADQLVDVAIATGAMAQTFVPLSTFSLGKVSVRLYIDTGSGGTAPSLIQLRVSSGYPGASTSLGLAVLYTSATSGTFVDFIFNDPIPLISGQPYFFYVLPLASGIKVSYDAAGTYGNTELFDGVSWNLFTGTMAFSLYSTAALTTQGFLNTDPSVMLTNVMDTYIGSGGIITYSAPTIDATALSLSYTFVASKILEVIKKCLDLAPHDWYWYVDVGTNVLYFKQTLTTATYMFVKGRHINNIKIRATIENLKNTIYFTGGSLGTNNLFKKYSDTTSITAWGQRLDTISDNRVTIDATANAIGNSHLAENKDEQYIITVELLDTTMDISLLRVGQTVGFNNFGVLVDNLILQIVRIDYKEEVALVTLGQLQTRFTDEIEQTVKSVDDVLTIANPTAPS